MTIPVRIWIAVVHQIGTIVLIPLGLKRPCFFSVKMLAALVIAFFGVAGDVSCNSRGGNQVVSAPRKITGLF